MSGGGLYRGIIAESVPGRTDEDYREIEDIMRHDIFHSTLDWQTRAQLTAAAREASKVLDLLRAGATEGREEDDGRETLEGG